MLEIGPFSLNDIEPIKKILQDKGVDFELIVDEDLRDRLKQEFDQRVREGTYTAIGTLDVSYFFFSFQADDFAKVKDEFERLGVAPQSDGSFELGLEGEEES